jgi:hypothetical protein
MLLKAMFNFFWLYGYHHIYTHGHTPRNAVIILYHTATFKLPSTTTRHHHLWKHTHTHTHTLTHTHTDTHTH